MSLRGKIMVFLPAGVVLCLVAVAYFLLNSQPGARWLWERASAALNGQLSAEQVNGSFRSGLEIQGLKFSDTSTLVQAGSLRTQIALDLFPPAVSIETLSADQILIRTLAESTQESNLADTLSKLVLPLPVSVGQLRLDHLLVQDRQEATIFEARLVHFSGLWFDQLKLDRGGLETNGMQLELSGKLGFSSPFPLDAAINTFFAETEDGMIPAPGLRLNAELEGNLDALAIDAELDQPGISLQGELTSLLSDPGLDVTLSSDAMQWPLSGESPTVSLNDGVIHLQGKLDNYELEIKGILGLPDIPLSQLSVEATGNTQGLLIRRLGLDGELVQLQAQGPVSWQSGFGLKLQSRIDRLLPSPWVADWPTDHPLQGQLDARWGEGRLDLRNFDLSAVDTGFRITGDGVFDPDQNIINASINWQGLQWPLAASEPGFFSETGELVITGRPDDWSANGRVQIRAADFPQGQLTINGKGNLESTEVQVLKGSVLGGQFEGVFAYRWVDTHPWSADIRATAIDITPLARDYPGVLNADLVARGQAQTGSLDLEIRSLTGTVRGQEIQANGAIAIDSGMLRAKGLQLRSGASHVLLNGNPLDLEGIQFTGDIQSLGAFIDEAGGAVSGSGRLSLNKDSPLLELDIEGKELQWGDAFLASFTAGPLSGEAGATQIELLDLTFGDRLVDRVSLVSRGTSLFDSNRVEALMNGNSLLFELEGKLHDWTDFNSIAWTGRLESLRMEFGESGFLQLDAPTGVSFSPTNTVIEPTCMTGAMGGHWCFDLSQESGEAAGDSLVVNLDLDQVSINPLRPILNLDLEFTQTVSGKVHWRKSAGIPAQAEVDLALSEGAISRLDGSAALATGPGILGFRIEEGKLEGGNLDIAIPDVGYVDTDFSAPGLSQGLNTPIEGRVLINFGGIDPFLPWIESLDVVEGLINADIRLGGTAANPRLTGHASLVRGRIEHLATGLVLSNIQLAGAVYDFNYTELNGSFMAGDGRGQMHASVKFDKILKPEILLEVSGKDLTLINVPDMLIRIDPDLNLRWQDSALTLNGNIVVPLAHISPRYLPSSSASESSDLVIVAGQPPVVEESIIDRSKLRLNGSVGVELGKEVTLTFERATAQLKGKTVFTWNNELMPKADGNYFVSGKITAYGQLLEVSEGRVSFPNVPADNPYLNITAEREIYGNVQVKQAGVLVSGTLKRPIVETYTRPATTKERALTLLITGHDFDYDQGVGAVEVGMYIAPKLYVSYGIGLFESGSVISARYDLGKGWGVKATSGQRETGGDVTYTIEN